MAAVPRRKVDELRELLGIFHKPREYFAAPPLTPLAGIPRGALIELVGNAKTEWLLQFCKTNPEMRVFWLEESLTLLPTAVEQRGADLSRFVFAEAPGDLFMTLRRTLQSHLFGCIVAPSSFREDKPLKALQLLAEKASASVFLLGKQPSSAWQISSQFAIHRDAESPSGYQFEVLKLKAASLA